MAKNTDAGAEIYQTCFRFMWSIQGGASWKDTALKWVGAWRIWQVVIYCAVCCW